MRGAPLRPCLCGSPLASHNIGSRRAGVHGNCVIAALLTPPTRGWLLRAPAQQPRARRHPEWSPNAAIF
eukprot:5484179-Pyramimonas_sp.AAC.1